jgi:hypothetical protein
VISIVFVNVVLFAGKVSIQNVLNATRVYINPAIAEVDTFKEL